MRASASRECSALVEACCSLAAVVQWKAPSPLGPFVFVESRHFIDRHLRFLGRNSKIEVEGICGSEALSERDGVHRTGACAAHPFDLDTTVFQQAIKHGSSKRTLKTTALQRSFARFPTCSGN